MDATVLPEGLTRADLMRAFNNDVRLARAFEKVLLTVAESSDVSTSTAAATTGMQNATAVLLSANDEFVNRRILAAVSPLALDDEGPGNDVKIGFGFSFVINHGGHGMVWNLLADTNVTFPPAGRLMVSGSGLSVYANDAAAAADGYDVGDIYKQTGGAMAWRQV